MATGVGVTLYASGVRVADGRAGDDPAAPNALSGLQVVWGRASNVDQPDPSQASFDLLDPPGGPSFRDAFTIGTPVQVQATGIIYPSPTVSTFPDPGFESGPPHVVTQSGATVRTARRKDTGTQSAWVTTDWLTKPGAPRRDTWAVFAPLAYVPPDGLPTAWDTIPKTAPGQTWSLTARLWVPSGTAVEVYPAYFTGPYATAYTLGDRAGSSQLDTGGAFATVGGTILPPPGVWVGLAVRLSTFFFLRWDSVAGSWDSKTLLWDEYGSCYVDNLQVLAPAAGTPSTVLVFDGRVVSMRASWDAAADCPLVHVQAVDFTADLDNRTVGDAPFLAEALTPRVDRVIALTGQSVNRTVDASVAPTVISWRDVDAQPAMGLLRDLAATVDAIAWPAVHIVTGPFLWYEDPRNRPPSRVLAKPASQVVLQPSVAGLTALSACEVPVDPVDWAQDVQDQSTQVQVTWQEQITGPPVSVTEHTLTLDDPAGQAARGIRRVSLTTQLTTSADASAVAQRLAARTQGGWHAEGLSLDDYDVDASDPHTHRLLGLLDGTTRIGQGIALGDLPAWVPGGPTVGVYIEGGTYTYTGGRWVLDLTVTNAPGQGHWVTWDDLTPKGATWTWDAFDPAIRWNDLAGVGVA